MRFDIKTDKPQLKRYQTPPRKQHGLEASNFSVRQACTYIHTYIHTHTPAHHFIQTIERGGGEAVAPTTACCHHLHIIIIIIIIIIIGFTANHSNIAHYVQKLRNSIQQTHECIRWRGDRQTRFGRKQVTVKVWRMDLSIQTLKLPAQNPLKLSGGTAAHPHTQKKKLEGEFAYHRRKRKGCGEEQIYHFLGGFTVCRVGPWKGKRGAHFERVPTPAFGQDAVTNLSRSTDNTKSLNSTVRWIRIQALYKVRSRRQRKQKGMGQGTNSNGV